MSVPEVPAARLALADAGNGLRRAGGGGFRRERGGKSGGVPLQITPTILLQLQTGAGTAAAAGPPTPADPGLAKIRINAFSPIYLICCGLGVALGLVPYLGHDLCLLFRLHIPDASGPFRSASRMLQPRSMSCLQMQHLTSGRQIDTHFWVDGCGRRAGLTLVYLRG
ncbi:hypothetical protein Zmor_025813 [Zophobas morio]|uniref:Uncharacterized protein n=1 Tax=Zophobas morio TaxID=2755281 RepID=A0AA38HUV0_9CUCU|nr:hypothetical protein Zmor_025813 [Zophobas morio]